MKRIVLTTFGSYGDVHPYIALSLALKRRGHAPVIATANYYRGKVEQEGIEFRAVAPDLEALGDPVEITRRVYDRRRGPQYIVQELMMPSLPRTFDTLLEATRDANLLLSHPLTYSAPLVAAKLELPWVATVLAPLSFMSEHDPPVLPPAPWLKSLHRRSPALYRLIFRAMKASVRKWTEPVHALARAQALPEPKQDPSFEGQFSPWLNLGLFSPLLAEPQPDWPPNTCITGFPFYDEDAVDPAAMRALDAFLDAGDAPIVFTLGSSAVYVAGDFYRIAIDIARRLGRRALLLTGNVEKNQRLGDLLATVHIAAYAPYSRVLPRAAAVVHQGGIGTLAQAMRAGRPMLVVPFAHDQLDNADRAARLGIGKMILQRKFSIEAGTRALDELLREPRYAEAAARVGRVVQQEDGAEAACLEIERLLRG